MATNAVCTRALSGVLVRDEAGALRWADDGAAEPHAFAVELGRFVPAPERVRQYGRGLVVLDLAFLAALDFQTVCDVDELLRAHGRVDRLADGHGTGTTRPRRPDRRAWVMPAAVWDDLMTRPAGIGFPRREAARIIARAERIERENAEAAAIEARLDRIRARFLSRWWGIYTTKYIDRWCVVSDALASKYPEHSPAFLAADLACWRALPHDFLLMAPDELRAWALATARSPLRRA